MAVDKGTGPPTVNVTSYPIATATCCLQLLCTSRKCVPVLVSLTLAKHCAMRTYGGAEIYLDLYWSVASFTLLLIYPRGKNEGYVFYRSLVGPRSLFGCCGGGRDNGRRGSRHVLRNKHRDASNLLMGHSGSFAETIVRLERVALHARLSFMSDIVTVT